MHQKNSPWDLDMLVHLSHWTFCHLYFFCKWSLEGAPKHLKIFRPPYEVEKKILKNIRFMGIIRSGLVRRSQNSWNFYASMSIAWEIMKKLPEKCQLFWNLLTKPDLMIPINLIFVRIIFYFIRGPENVQGLWGTL